MAEEGEPVAAAYGTAPVGHSLAWIDIKLSEIKDFMHIDKVPPSLPLLVRDARHSSRHCGRTCKQAGSKGAR